MIQDRINGANAAASSRKRRTDSPFHAVHDVFGPRHPFRWVNLFPSVYQAKKIEIASRIPPTVAMTSPRSRRVKSIADWRSAVFEVVDAMSSGA
jgi:hypothetical protein